MPRATIRIRSSDDLGINIESIRKRRKGEVLHLALSCIKTLEETKFLEKVVLKALSFFGEKPHFWDIENDFIKPLQKVFKLPQVQKFFSPEVKEIYRERSILALNEKGVFQVFRPDRIIVFDDQVIVVDFKSERPFSSEILNKYRNQMARYVTIVSKIFNLPTEGYLLFLLVPQVEKVLLQGC